MGIGFAGLIWTSCVDEDDYTVISEGNKVELDGGIRIDMKSGDTVLIKPKFKYLDNRDTSIFEYTWYIAGEKVHEGRSYEFTTHDLQTQRGFISARNTKNNVISKVGGFVVYVTAAFEEGYYVLYEENGQTKLGVINRLFNSTTDGYEYKVDEGIYEAVNGETLDTDSYRLQVLTYSNSIPGMMIMTSDGHGTRTINPNVATQENWLEKEFNSGTFPTQNFSPVSVMKDRRVMILFDAEGQAYLRALPGNVHHSDIYAIPYSDTPAYIEGIGNDYSFTHGYQDGNANRMYMYNKKGNYLMSLYVRSSTVEFQRFPEIADLPDDYSPLHDFGDMEVVFVGYYKDFGRNTGINLILKDQAGDYYQQVFREKPWGRGFEIKKGEDDRIPFTLEGANEDTEFLLYPKSDYILYSGGANNDKVYFIDLQKRSTLKTISIREFASFNSKITSMTYVPRYNASERKLYYYLLVGFENGDFKVFDITNPDFDTTQTPVFEHTFGNKVKDVAFNRRDHHSW